MKSTRSITGALPALASEPAILPSPASPAVLIDRCWNQSLPRFKVGARRLSEKQAGTHLFVLHKAHAHPACRAHGLAGQPLGATPGAEAPGVLGDFGVLHIAMRTPAIAIFGAGEFGRAARLRAAGKAAREIDRLA